MKHLRIILPLTLLLSLSLSHANSGEYTKDGAYSLQKSCNAFQETKNKIDDLKWEDEKRAYAFGAALVSTPVAYKLFRKAQHSLGDFRLRNNIRSFSDASAKKLFLKYAAKKAAVIVPLTIALGAVPAVVIESITKHSIIDSLDYGIFLNNFYDLDTDKACKMLENEKVAGELRKVLVNINTEFSFDSLDTVDAKYEEYLTETQAILDSEEAKKISAELDQTSTEGLMKIYSE